MVHLLLSRYRKIVSVLPFTNTKMPERLLAACHMPTFNFIECCQESIIVRASRMRSGHEIRGNYLCTRDAWDIQVHDSDVRWRFHLPFSPMPWFFPKGLGEIIGSHVGFMRVCLARRGQCY